MKVGDQWVYSPVEVLAEHRAIWSKWWQEGMEPQPLDIGSVPLGDILCPITIRGVAGGFKKVTACNDGHHPRQFKGLSDSALTCLGLLFRLFEVNGQWPTVERAVIVALIPKTDGGLRPIALFRTAYRIYAKAQARSVRKWAAALPDAQCNNSKGRWVGDYTWRAQVRAVTQSHKHHIEFLMYVKKAFEHVRRSSVAREAMLQDYPMIPLMASMASYAWPRYMGWMVCWPNPS